MSCIKIPELMEVAVPLFRFLYIKYVLLLSTSVPYNDIPSPESKFSVGMGRFFD